MASLEQQKRGGNYRVIFWFDGKKFSRTLKTSDDQEANAAVQRIEENIRLVERGRLEIPPDADVMAFLLSDGKLGKKPTLQKSVTLDELLTGYKDQLPRDSIEANTRCTMEIHLNAVVSWMPSRRTCGTACFSRYPNRRKSWRSCVKGWTTLISTRCWYSLGIREPAAARLYASG